WSLTTRNRARYADKLGAHLISRQSDLRITVSSKIDELEVRRQIRVRQRPCALQVEALCIFEARADAVLQQHVEGPFRLRCRLLVREKQRSERSVLRQIVLIGLHGAGADKRRAYETQADRLELAGGKFRARVSGPEAVAIARDDGEACDLRVANEIVDFSALQVRGAVVPSSQRSVSVPGPRLPGETRGQVLRVGAPVQRSERVTPDFPRRRRASELVLEPCLLLRPEN